MRRSAMSFFFSLAVFDPTLLPCDNTPSPGNAGQTAFDVAAIYLSFLSPHFFQPV